MKKGIVVSAVAASTLMAGGYKIPENSINATALSAAYVANAHGADAAYYNPAAMVYNEDANQMEIDATYIHLTPINFSGTTGSYSSKDENFLVPSLHFSSKKLGDTNTRVGLSVIVPAGLSKRWDSAVPKASAEEFTLETVEVNPSVAFALNDSVSFGAGFRMIHTSGVVKSSAAVSRDMEGDSIDYGYNVAVMLKPTKDLSLAATYRSKINLSVEGNAKLYSGATLAYNGDVSVKVPVPAALNLAVAYTYGGTTFEAVFERTYWSAYQNLDFNYPVSIGGLAPYFDNPVSKNWKDTSTYRLGLTHQYDDRLTAMAGIAYDETPVPESTLGYELPDSDAWIFSLGGKCKVDSHWTVGLAGLVDAKKSRSVYQAPASGIKGEFTDGRAYLITAGIEYRF